VKKVSVITVCFNSSNTIKRTIDSVNNQTYLNIEHIIIDGNSVDETLKIVNQHKSRTGPVISEADHGIYDAMNKGLVKASGDIICFLNSDDEFHSLNLVADVMEVFENDRLDLVYGDVIYVSNQRRPIRYYKSKSFTVDKLGSGFMPAHPSLFIRANIYKLLRGFRADFKIAGDFEICCRIFQIPNLQTCYLERPFVNMQMGGASAVSFSNILLVNREILEACLSNGIKTNYLKLFKRYFRKIYEFKF
jgi:glycosyltransferase involved in cell wall biosynthesis